MNTLIITAAFSGMPPETRPTAQVFAAYTDDFDKVSLGIAHYAGGAMTEITLKVAATPIPGNPLGMKPDTFMQL